MSLAVAGRAGTIAVLLIATSGCGESLITPMGTPGAGVTTEIVRIDRDSTGYTVRFRMTNRDTADVGFHACMGAVQVPADTGWTSVTQWGQCVLWLGLLPPTRSVELSIPQQELAAGTQARVIVPWSFVYSRSGGISTTEPMLVP